MPPVAIPSEAPALTLDEQIVRFLLAGKAAALSFLPLVTTGPTRRAEDVLASHPRRRVYSLVKRSPGLSLLEIGKRLEMGRSSLDLHVGGLLAAGLVETRHVGRFVCVYPAGQAPDDNDPVLLPETTRRVALLVLKEPRTSLDLAKLLDMSDRAARHHLGALTRCGLVAEDRRGNARLYVPTDQLEDAAAAWRRK